MNSKEKFILALDQGTTSSRAIIYNHKGEIVATSQKDFEQIFTQPGWVEHDPHEIWYTQSSVAAESVAKSNLDGTNIAAIGISNQRETYDCRSCRNDRLQYGTNSHDDETHSEYLPV